jgi:metal-responsive CopG/Arc/MetJ family transcriptional regulator
METKKDKKLQIRLDEDLWTAVQDACEEENRTVSNLIRTALIAYLKQRKSK